MFGQGGSLGITAACYRTEKPKSPKVPGRVLGGVPGKRGLLGGLLGAVLRASVSMEKQRNGTARSSPPSSPLFPGTLPSTLPDTFGDFGFLGPVAGGRDSYGSLMRSAAVSWVLHHVHVLALYRSVAGEVPRHEGPARIRG